MEKNDSDYFKEKLLAEKTKIEAELATVSRKNPDDPTDYEPMEKNDPVTNEADPNERADAQEEFAENTLITDQLELQLDQVDAALKRIDEGTYGICKISGEQIEKERLEANPSATTCKQHINE